MHIKTASNDYPILDLLRDRWSPRAFNGLGVENARLLSIFEAARWSPSASNLQPWRFMVGFKGDKTYEKIAATLVEFNQLWATTAPVLLLAIAKNTNNRGDRNVSAVYDLGQAVAYLTFQASAEGLSVHQMGGFDKAKATELFEIPEDFSVETAIAIGYEGDPEILHENLKKMEISPRERQKTSGFIFAGKFGQSTDIFNQ